MVASRIAPSLNYPDPSAKNPQQRSVLGPVAPTDKGHRAAVYELQLPSPFVRTKRYPISVGKANFDHSTQHGVIYVYVYLAKAGKAVGAIGVVEFEKHAFTARFDEQRDLDLRDQTVLLYPGITPAFLTKIRAEAAAEDLATEDSDAEDSDAEDSETKDSETSGSADTGASAKGGPPVIPAAEPGVKKLTRSDVLQEEQATAVATDPSTPAEEVRSIRAQMQAAKQARDEYARVESASDTWLQRHFQSKDYRLHENVGGGDCLFLAIVEAYRSIGVQTSVEKLRQVVAQEATRAQFDERRSLFSGIDAAMVEERAAMTKLRQSLAELQKRAAAEKNKAEAKRLLAAAAEIQSSIRQHQRSLDGSAEAMAEFRYLRNVTTMEEYRNYLRCPDFWADAWAIAVVERVLSLKLVVLEKSSDKDNVIHCGQTVEGEAGVTNPRHYILIEYDPRAQHFRLISYRDRKIFSFEQLPFDVKMMVVNKCVELAAGPFYAIADFKQFQHDVGVETSNRLGDTAPASSASTSTSASASASSASASASASTSASASASASSEEDDVADLFDPTIVFRFHADSDASRKPGEVNGEKLPKKRAPEFAELAKQENWRQKIDDDWTGAPFTVEVDGQKMRWASVTHFVSAAPLLSLIGTDIGWPKGTANAKEAFAEFSLDSGSALSKSAASAREAVTKKGKKQGKYYAPVELALARAKDTAILATARKRALFAKFSQNADLTTILSHTRQAKLLHFVRGQEPEPDVLLMAVRRKVAKTG